MYIEDLVVGDVADFYYFAWNQQIIVRGTVKEINDTSVVFDVPNSPTYVEVPKNHLLYRQKREDEIQAELLERQRAAEMTMQITKVCHLSGVNFIEKNTNKVVINKITPSPISDGNEEVKDERRKYH